MHHADRLKNFAEISTAIALCSDKTLTRLVDEAPQLAVGIGGTTMLMDIEGFQVFAKRVRLTDLERRPEHVMSTANVFDMPTFCQRNVGSPGFSVWRELAANVMVTNWVLSGQTENFSLMYHWRVLPGAASPQSSALPDEMSDIEGMTRYWNNSEAMGARLRALTQASASVLIFLEFIPHHLDGWLSDQLALSAVAFECACAMVEHGLDTDLPRMNKMGLLHCDAHFKNILTDGKRLYFADLGLSLSSRFDLTDAERAFVQQNANLDRCYAPTKWVNWLVKAWTPDASPQERMALVCLCAEGQRLAGLPPKVSAIIQRRAPMAVIINEFYATLHNESRSAPFPWQEIDRLNYSDPLDHNHAAVSPEAIAE